MIEDTGEVPKKTQRASISRAAVRRPGEKPRMTGQGERPCVS
jgi:hypothetical protein